MDLHDKKYITLFQGGVLALALWVRCLLLALCGRTVMNGLLSSIHWVFGAATLTLISLIIPLSSSI
jgi:hypothetical protein